MAKSGLCRQGNLGEILAFDLVTSPQVALKFPRVKFVYLTPTVRCFPLSAGVSELMTPPTIGDSPIDKPIKDALLQPLDKIDQ